MSLSYRKKLLFVISSWFLMPSKSLLAKTWQDKILEDALGEVRSPAQHVEEPVMSREPIREMKKSLRDGMNAKADPGQWKLAQDDLAVLHGHARLGHGLERCTEMILPSWPSPPLPS